MRKAKSIVSLLAANVLEFASISGNVAWVSLIDPNGNLLVAAAIDSKIPTILRIDSTGIVETLVTIPDAIFLNGMTHLTGDRYLVADSYKGAIWEVDAIAKTARIWLQDSLLSRSDTSNPVPAINGIKISNNALFASNTQRQLLIRVPISAENFTAWNASGVFN